MKKTAEDHICAFCEHYIPPFGFFEEGSKCSKTGNYTSESSTCINFKQQDIINI